MTISWEIVWASPLSDEGTRHAPVWVSPVCSPYNGGSMTHDMPRLAVSIGASLIVLGVAMYFLSGRVSLTALIPVPFGAALVTLGWVAKRSASTKHPMHGAAVVALVGIAGSWNGVPQAARLLLGDEVANPLAAGAKTVMAALLAVFLAYCIHSFRQARKARG